MGVCKGEGAEKRDGLFIGLWETDPPQGQLAKYKTEVALSVYGLDGERRLSPLPSFGHIDRSIVLGRVKSVMDSSISRINVGQ